MNKLRHITVGFLLLLTVAACGPKKQDTTALSTGNAVPVTLMPLEATDTIETVAVTGTFTTDDETILAFKNGGIVQQIDVKEGEAFKKGQLLATLEPAEINTAVRQSQLALQKAERDYKRAQQLYLDSVATLEQLENAQTAFEAAQQDTERANYQVRHASIHAAFDGYVLQRSANAGQVVGPGTPVLLVSGSGRGGWLLRTGVSDKQWSAIQVGDRATVTRDAANNIPLTATVQRKSEGIDPQSGTFTIYLKLENEQLSSLASGMFGKAEIHLSAKKGGWFIPYDALLDGDAGTGYVFITNDGQTAQRVPVQVGEINKDHVVVTGGLERAKSLIVSGSPYLRDGSTITVK